MTDMLTRHMKIERAIDTMNKVKTSSCHLQTKGVCPQGYVKPCGKQVGIEYVKLNEDRQTGKVMTVRNWTQPGSDNEPYCWGRLKSAHEHIWEANFEANKPRIKQMFPKGRPDEDAPKFGQTGYLLGNGPGLKVNGDLLKDVKGDIWGCNRHGDLDVPLDYYMVLDARCKDYEESIKKINKDVTPIFSVFANPEVTKHFNTNNALWYNVWGAGSKLHKRTRKFANKKFKAEDFSKLDSGFNVCYSMLHAMYKMGYEKIVILGMDYAFSGGYEYFNSPNDDRFIYADKEKGFVIRNDMQEKYNKMGGLHKVRDAWGQETFTCQPMQMAAMMMKTAAYWLKDKVELVNCTEAGLDIGIKNDRLENNLC